MSGDAPKRPWRLSNTAEWLITEGWRIRSTGKLVDAVCDHLVDEGVPLWRFATFVATLHPEMFGDNYVWTRGGERQYRTGSHDMFNSPVFAESPVRVVRETGRPVRRRLTGPDAVVDFPVLEDLRDGGVTDYLALPLTFTDGTNHTISLSTDHPDGFSDDHIALLEDLAPLLARIAEIHATKRVAERLLDTYVGPDAGHRILAGQIQRGSGDTIDAAIWFCDLRGFTVLSDTLPRDAMIALLNAYFDRMAEPVQAHGGEVLKFIGDAMLAIFPVDANDREASARKACRAALEAAGAAVGGMEDLNRQRAQDGTPQLDFGIALHIGDVQYGNIGASNRLDYTVIGPAVNLASRIEGLCKPLGQKVLASRNFARLCTGPLVSLGLHELQGVAAQQEVFALAMARIGQAFDNIVLPD